MICLDKGHLEEVIQTGKAEMLLIYFYGTFGILFL